MNAALDKIGTTFRTEGMEGRVEVTQNRRGAPWVWPDPTTTVCQSNTIVDTLASEPSDLAGLPRTFWNSLPGTENRAWFGQWDHVRGNDLAGEDEPAMGRRGFFDEVMRFVYLYGDNAW